jgi:hypothetical protein
VGFSSRAGESWGNKSESGDGGPAAATAIRNAVARSPADRVQDRGGVREQHGDRDELAQEIAAQLWRSFGRFDDRRAKFSIGCIALR